MESNFRTKAVDLETRGDKALKGSFFSNLTTGKADRADTAKELYLQAVNCYKLAEDNGKALICMHKAIKCEEND